MGGRARPADAPAAVLRIGDAVALLLQGVADAPDAHLAAATEALRSFAGRPDLAIGRRPSGRPKLLAPLPELGVSLAARADCLAIGFSPTATIGVDIERDDPAMPAARMAADHFLPAEALFVGGGSDEAGRRDRFFRLWTCKEAVLKATGRGIVDGLDEPDLSDVAELLLAEGGPVDGGATARVPAHRVAVTRMRDRTGVAVWIALAVVEDGASTESSP